MGNKCEYLDLNFASAQEVFDGFGKYPAAQPADRILFDKSMAVITSQAKLMAWGPNMHYFTKQFPDVIFNSKVHSSHPTHAEYYEPFLSDKWQKHRATIIFTPAKPCALIKAQKGALWTEDGQKANGAFDRAAARMKSRGVEVELGKTTSPPLGHPYIVIGEMGDNWGWLSSHIPGRTVDWGNLDKNLEADGCTRAELMEWLDNPMVKGVVVQTHMDVVHPKILTVPLGIEARRKTNMWKRLQALQKNYPKKVRLILINNSCQWHRGVLTRMIEKQIDVFNTYGSLTDETYSQGVASSKFVLSPSGMGFDCYRIWEVLMYGSIPVVEHSPLPSGWDKVLDDLPVLWVKNFTELTTELLETSYPKIMARHRNYNYEKLEQKFWRQRILDIANA
jgi:hypothetical protein